MPGIAAKLLPDRSPAGGGRFLSGGTMTAVIDNNRIRRRRLRLLIGLRTSRFTALCWIGINVPLFLFTGSL